MKTTTTTATALRLSPADAAKVAAALGLLREVYENRIREAGAAFLQAGHSWRGGDDYDAEVAALDTFAAEALPAADLETALLILAGRGDALDEVAGILESADLAVFSALWEELDRRRDAGQIGPATVAAAS